MRLALEVFLEMLPDIWAGCEVSEEERRYEDGGDPRVLDVIDVPLLKHRPHACQVENWHFLLPSW